MKVCPMCGMPQLKKGLPACQFCGYEEKPLSELSKKQIHDLMDPYEYEKTEDGGIRIEAVKNIRSIALRDAIAIPHFVTEIAAHAFSHCKFLTGVELPKGLRSIGDGAFAHCRDLFHMFIPAQVSHIGKGAFSDCYDLGTIDCAAPEKPDGWDDMWLADCDATVRWASTDEA